MPPKFARATPPVKDIEIEVYIKSLEINQSYGTMSAEMNLSLMLGPNTAQDMTDAFSDRRTPLSAWLCFRRSPSSAGSPAGGSMTSDQALAILTGAVRRRVIPKNK